MNAFRVATPFELFFDTAGKPLEDGSIFIGEAGQNPEITPISVYWDAAFTIPAAQPIRTVGGYMSRNGSPGVIFLGDIDYSIVVRDKQGRLVYSKLSGNQTLDYSAISDEIESVVTLTPLKDVLPVVNGVQEYTFPNALFSGATYFVSEPEGQSGKLLVEDTDFQERADISDKSIELLTSFPAGWELTATYTSGVPGVIRSRPTLMNVVADAVASTAIKVGSVVQTLGYRSIGDGGDNTYLVVAAGTATEDLGRYINLTGAVGQLQGLFPRGIVTARQFGATGDAVTDDKPFFDAAAAYARQRVTDTNGTATQARVTVTPGRYLLSAATANSAIWVVEPGAEMLAPPNVAGSNIDNTSYLTGVKVHTVGRGTNLFHVGGTDPWTEGFRPASISISSLSSISPDGRAGLYACSRYSDRAADGAGCIGVGAIAVADQTVDATNSVWAMYAESAKYNNVNGNAFALESNVTNYTGAIQSIDPSIVPQGTDRFTVNLWTGGPVGDPGPDTPGTGAIFPSTAAIVVSPGGVPFANGGFDKGVVFLDASFQNGSKEVIACSIDHKYMAYSTSSRQLSYFETTEPVVDEGRWSLRVKTTGGTWVLYRYGVTQFSPDDNTVNLGTASRRWTEVFAVSGSINTSDIREKQDIRALSAAELAVAQQLKGLIKAYRFKDAVAEKGDTARIHVGAMAQEVAQAFTDNGLDPFAYGIVCYDEFEGGNRYGLRYTEMLAFIIATL